MLSGGPLSQNWSDPALFTANSDYSNIKNIVGYNTDVDADALSPGMFANQLDPNTVSIGGVAEFDTLANPTVAIQGSGAAATPQLLFDLNTTGVAQANVAMNLRDIDGSADNADQFVSVEYRVGNTGNWSGLNPAVDATEGPASPRS